VETSIFTPLLRARFLHFGQFLCQAGRVISGGGFIV
jgi:hypothetical protein